MFNDSAERRFPIGAEVTENGTHFRVWAPEHDKVEVVVRSLRSPSPGRSYPLEQDREGYFAGLVKDLGPDGLYSFQIDNDPQFLPDPASRFQPEGPHGPSQIIDSGSYVWHDEGFKGPNQKGKVLYEVHIGTFTQPGTYRAAAQQLPELSRIGITMLELMPLADFPGLFGWGYDGVALWAPTRLYGRPDELRSLVDQAHQMGISVILDVVYNHFGPDGNYLKNFSEYYFTDRYDNEWGEALNFDGPCSGAVREFFVQNARYWIEEYHFDGLRLDATQSIFDTSDRHIIAEITTVARAAAGRKNRVPFIAAENESQRAKVARSVEEGGCGCDALWNDDFHHTAHVALTGRIEAYYSDYRGTPQEFISAIKWGYLYQGQHYYWQKKERGSSALDVGASGFISYLENHDQIANSVGGSRLDRFSDPALLRAVTALFLLAPATPLLFQGQEFASSAPFLYFADHNEELASLVARGRKEFLHQFPSVSHPEVISGLHDPSDPDAFERCKLDFLERESHAETYQLYCDLLKLRRDDPAFSEQDAGLVEGAVLSSDAFLLRYFCSSGDRLVLVNLGSDLDLIPAPEPLLAPPEKYAWRLIWCSESPRYGGQGFGPVLKRGKWRLTGRCLHVLTAERDMKSSAARGRGDSAD